MKIILIIGLLLIAFFLLGCTESQQIMIPYTTSQFINKTTDFNSLTFNNGGLSGQVLVIDGNKISSLDTNDLNVSFYTDLDGGFANSTYLPTQYIDGGSA